MEHKKIITIIIIIIISKIITVQSLVLMDLTFLRMSLPTAVSVIIGLK